MSTAVIHMTKCSEGSMLASARIARYISNLAGFVLLHDPKEIDFDATYDNLILVNGPSGFCKWLDPLAAMVNRCKHLIWASNDYSVYPPTQVRRVLLDRWNSIRKSTWSTIPDLSVYADRVTYNLIPLTATRYVNWNQLTYEDLPPNEPKGDYLWYYGAYRKDREKYFDLYFSSGLYETIVSCPDRAQEDFENLGPKVFTEETFESLSSIRRKPFTIYMEDKFSHLHYCSPANRFYECLSAGIPMLFEPQAANTFRRWTDYDPTPYVVRDANDVSSWLRKGTSGQLWVRNTQMNKWKKDYRAILDSQLKEALCDLS